jgi:hypothetical protein
MTGEYRATTPAKILRLCIVAMLAAAIGACHRDTGEAPAASKPAAKPRAPLVAKKGPSAQEQTAGMVSAASQGKSALPILVKFDLLKRPTVGQALEIDIAVVPQITGTTATIQIAGSEGLKLVAADSEIVFPAIEAEQVYRRTISVTPTTEGVLYLGLTVTLQHDEITESRAFSVPIIVEPSREIAAKELRRGSG